MIDSHCHLNFHSIKDDFENIILEIKKANLTSLLTINTLPSEFNDHLNLIKNYKSIYISYGLHPQNVDNKITITKDEILNNILSPKVIGIGETGLDFYHSTEYKKNQYKVFENHIDASIESKLPLIIHQRSSEDEIIDVLNNYQKNHKFPVVFHCFTGSKKLLNFCLDNLYYISLSGIITFKNADKLRDIIKFADKDYLLIETDSPFLAPMPMRGKSNKPSYVKYTAEFLSNFYNISFDKFVEITNNNFYKLFSKAKRYNEFQ